MISRPVMREFERSYMITACFTADIQDQYRSAARVPRRRGCIFDHSYDECTIRGN